MTTPAPDILLVEDHGSAVELFKLALEVNQSRATLAVARDGVEAIAFLYGSEGAGAPAATQLPRLVLLDLNMPRINGFQVLEQVRADARTRDLVVVVFTASDQIADEREARRLGAHDVVRKPVEFEQLCRTVAAMEYKWLSADCAKPAPAATVPRLGEGE